MERHERLRVGETSAKRLSTNGAQESSGIRLRVGETSAKRLSTNGAQESSGMIQRLFKQHYAEMLRVARTILYDEQESKDVVSDIFEGLLRGQTVLMPDTEERYLLTSVRNQCLKRIRHQETRLRMEAAPAEQPSDAEDEDERMTDIVEFVVSHLTEQEPVYQVNWQA